ncbi:MAG: tetratricopeptide repeat protein [Flammeovirgaceae bacterium]|nr:tetratricopeptide repeat protein [Flammeovirgaceae bacterium]
MNAGVFFAPSAGEYDKAIKLIKEYQEKGGTSPDAYVMLFSIYRDQQKDNEAALKLSEELVAKYPNNPEYPKFLLDMYVKMNKLPEAKELMMKQAAADPQNKESRYFVGIICSELNDPAGAKKWFEEAIKIDPTYFEPQLGLAELVYLDAKTIKAEMNQLGNSKEDFNKKVKLDKEYQDKLKVALPYWTNCEKLSPDDEKVLDTLYLIYADLEMTADVARIEKRMKALGLLD